MNILSFFRCKMKKSISVSDEKIYCSVWSSSNLDYLSKSKKIWDILQDIFIYIRRQYINFGELNKKEWYKWN